MQSQRVLIMDKFVKLFLVPLIKSRGWNRICEIGSSMGKSTGLLRGFQDLEVTVIDPCLDCDLQQKFVGSAHIHVRKGLSLEVLPELSQPFDCILIDGDHNWYTVYNELRVISERNLLRSGGVIFFHDVQWPWGRRDMYYQPDLIPPEYRHSWKQLGVVRGKSELAGIEDDFAIYKKATFEGGARNGVLTAIEDFLANHKGQYRFLRVVAGAGLGIMQYRGDMRDDLWFLTLACKAFICNAVFRVLRMAKMGFSSALFWKSAPPPEKRSSHSGSA